MSFDAVFANPTGRTSRTQYMLALIPLLLAVALYTFVVKGRTGAWSLAALMFPALVLHARRLHDLGRTAWLLIAPAALLVAALWLRLANAGAEVKAPVTLAAQVVAAAFVLWGVLAKGRAEPNRFGEA